MPLWFFFLQPSTIQCRPKCRCLESEPQTVRLEARTGRAAYPPRAARPRVAGSVRTRVRARCAAPTRNRPCTGCSCRSRSAGCNTYAIWPASGTRTTRTAGCSTRAATSRTPSIPATLYADGRM